MAEKVNQNEKTQAHLSVRGLQDENTFHQILRSTQFYLTFSLTCSKGWAHWEYNLQEVT